MTCGLPSTRSGVSRRNASCGNDRVGRIAVDRTRPQRWREMPVDLQPTLRGTLIELRPLCESDWDALYAVAADPMLWAQHPARDRYEEDVFREFFRVAVESQSALVARDLQTERVIGSSRYHNFNVAAREIEIGWSFLARAYWGGRYNGEMKQLMLTHAFTFVDRVIFSVGAKNIRSQLAVQRIGAVRLDVHPAIVAGTLVFGLDKSAYVLSDKS
jgi:N-acetyltransferase